MEHIGGSLLQVPDRVVVVIVTLPRAARSECLTFHMPSSVKALHERLCARVTSRRADEVLGP